VSTRPCHQSTLIWFTDSPRLIRSTAGRASRTVGPLQRMSTRPASRL
jgi:hypothetical protein